MYSSPEAKQIKAENFFNEVRHLKQRIHDVEERLETIKDDIRGLDYTRLKVDGGKLDDPMLSRYIRLQEYERETKERIAEMVDLKLEAHRVVNHLGAQHQCVLFYFYIEAENANLAAQHSHYSEPQFYRVKKTALYEAADYISDWWFTMGEDVRAEV